jgi:hypothetical protein
MLLLEYMEIKFLLIFRSELDAKFICCNFLNENKLITYWQVYQILSGECKKEQPLQSKRKTFSDH